ncbi:hypothetical protein AM593_02203, partial [Mytilus galloprovincialis]
LSLRAIVGISGTTHLLLPSHPVNRCISYIDIDNNPQLQLFKPTLNESQLNVVQENKMEEIKEQNGMKSRETPEKTSPVSNGSSISNGISNGAGNGFAMKDLKDKTSDVSDKNGKLLPKQDELVVTTIRLKPQIGLFQAVCIIVGIIIGSGMSIVMWTVCGSFSTLCALCFAELGACIPESGGEYTYIRRAFGLLIIVNCVNVKWATKVQIVITASKLIALFMIIIIGFVYIGNGHVENFYNSFEGSDYSAGAIAISFYSGFWAFGGW